MKILLTGKTGQIGFELASCLQAAGQVIAPDRSQADLANTKQLRSVIRTIRPDLIVNAAAFTDVEGAEFNSALATLINSDAPALMAEEAKLIGAGLIHYSTDYVFSGNKAGAYTEADTPAPLNAYGRSKLAGELAIAATGARHIIFRTSWVYGTRRQNFLTKILRHGEQTGELKVVDDQYGAPTWSRTIANATGELVRRIPRHSNQIEWWPQYGGIYHLTANGRTTWYGFAEEVLAESRMAGKVVLTPIKTNEYRSPAIRPRNSILDCERFRRVFVDLPDWREELKSCLSSGLSP